MKRLILALIIGVWWWGSSFATTFNSAADGEWNSNTTWGTAAGSVEGTNYPGSNDTVNINHTVTLTGSYPASGWGIGALTVNTSNGNLTFNTSANQNNYLQMAGNLTVWNYSSFCMGYPGSPIPTTSNATIAFNGTNLQYGITAISNATVKMLGSKVNNYKSILQSNITAGDKNFTVFSSDGWLIGDMVLIHKTRATNNQESEYFNITGISGTNVFIDSNGDGTGASPSFAYPHNKDIYVWNMRHNAIIKSTSSTMTKYIDTVIYNRTYMLIDEVSFYNSPIFRADAGSDDFCDISNVSHFGSSSSATFNFGSWGKKFNMTNFVDRPTDSTDQISNSAGGQNELNIYDSLICNGGTTYNRIARYGYIGNLINTTIVGAVNEYEILSLPVYNATNSSFWGIYGSSNTGPCTFLYNGESCSFNGCRGGLLSSRFKVLKNSRFGNIVNNTADIIGDGDSRNSYCYNVTFSMGSQSNLGARELNGVYSQNHNGTAGRNAVYFIYGTISDPFTGGKSAGWARSNDTCVYLSPSSTTAGQTLNWEFKVPVTASTNPQLSFYTNTTGTTNGATASIDVYDNSDDNTLLVDNQSITLGSSWAQFNVSAFTPTNTGYVRCVIKVLDGSTTGDVGFDDFQIVKGGVNLTDGVDYWTDGLPQLWMQGGGGTPGNTTTVSGYSRGRVVNQ